MSTYALCGVITFPKHKGRQEFKIRRFSECKIESSFKGLTDTAEIILPRKVKDFDRMKIEEWFRPGDPVKIELGYNNNFHTEFVGYIKATPGGIPLTLDCENEMYHLKRKVISVSKRSCKLKELLQAIVPGYEIVCDETQLMGTFRFDNMTQAQCLDELKKQGIVCYFVDKVLHALDTRSRLDGRTHSILIESTAFESIKLKEVHQTKVLIELIRKIGKRVKVEHGDENPGLVIKRTYSGLKMSESEMQNMAKSLYKLAKTPGLDGDVTLFGIPRVKVGDYLKISSSIYKDAPEYGKAYSVDAVTKTFNSKGFRQVCKLGDIKI